MSDYFRILAVKPEWILDTEALGSKEKFWYKASEDTTEWLYKYPENNTGQHWSEKIAAEIAGIMGISHAKVELAVFNGIQGSVTESFVRKKSEDLFHGNQILAGQLLGYNQQKRFKQSEHTLDNIFLALDRTFADEDGIRKIKTGFSNYLVLDAVIGNTDRHHENWGILRKRVNDHWVGRLAPTFDHASSLGRELRDVEGNKCRSRILQENKIGEYSEKAHGAIYWQTTDKHGKSLLELLRLADGTYGEFIQTALKKVKKLDKPVLESIIQKVPEDWMTPLARQFAVDLMCYNIDKLKEIIK